MNSSNLPIDGQLSSDMEPGERASSLPSRASRGVRHAHRSALVEHRRAFSPRPLTQPRPRMLYARKLRLLYQGSRILDLRTALSAAHCNCPASLAGRPFSRSAHERRLSTVGVFMAHGTESSGTVAFLPLLQTGYHPLKVRLWFPSGSGRTPAPRRVPH
jgi:hypothetical protein